MGSGSGPWRVALAWSPREFWSGSYVSKLPRLGSKRWVKGAQREPKELGWSTALSHLLCLTVSLCPIIVLWVSDGLQFLGQYNLGKEGKSDKLQPFLLQLVLRP